MNPEKFFLSDNSNLEPVKTPEKVDWKKKLKKLIALSTAIASFIASKGDSKEKDLENNNKTDAIESVENVEEEKKGWAGFVAEFNSLFTETKVQEAWTETTHTETKRAHAGANTSFDISEKVTSSKLKPELFRYSRALHFDASSIQSEEEFEKFKDELKQLLGEKIEKFGGATLPENYVVSKIEIQGLANALGRGDINGDEKNIAVAEMRGADAKDRILSDEELKTLLEKSHTKLDMKKGVELLFTEGDKSFMLNLAREKNIDSTNQEAAILELIQKRSLGQISFEPEKEKKLKQIIDDKMGVMVTVTVSSKELELNNGKVRLDESSGVEVTESTITHGPVTTKTVHHEYQVLSLALLLLLLSSLRPKPTPTININTENNLEVNLGEKKEEDEDQSSNVIYAHNTPIDKIERYSALVASNFINDKNYKDYLQMMNHIVKNDNLKKHDVKKEILNSGYYHYLNIKDGDEKLDYMVEVIKRYMDSDKDKSIQEIIEERK